MISIIMQFLIFFEFLFAIWGITALYKVTGMSRSVSTPHGCVLHRNGTHFNFSYSLYQSLYDYFIDLVDLGRSGHGDARQKLGHLLRRKIFAAALARVGGVHAHEIFIGVAKGVDGIVAVIAELHIAHAVHQLDQPLVALGNRAAQFVAVDVDVVKKPAEIRLAVAALGGVLDCLKHRFQRFVQILVQRRAAADAAKQLAWQDEKALCFDEIVPGLLRVAVRKPGVVKIRVARLALAVVDVVCKVFGNIALKQHAEHILLKIPAVHAPAQIVCNAPDRAVQLIPLLLFSIVCHKNALSFFCAVSFIISRA